jgi:hypothetical protein
MKEICFVPDVEWHRRYFVRTWINAYIAEYLERSGVWTTGGQYFKDKKEMIQAIKKWKKNVSR